MVFEYYFINKNNFLLWYSMFKLLIKQNILKKIAIFAKITTEITHSMTVPILTRTTIKKSSLNSLLHTNDTFA